MPPPFNKLQTYSARFHPQWQKRRLQLASLIIVLFILVFVVPNEYQLRNLISYAFRPIWDKAGRNAGPSRIITHYYTEDVKVINEGICNLHGWKRRTTPKKKIVKVFDAILMSSELDLLEIRLHELDPVVDRFFIVESNTTFSGLPKKTYFKDNRERFDKFKSKIEYVPYPDESLSRGETAFVKEFKARQLLTTNIDSHVTELPPSVGETLVIMADVDEIPSRNAIQLLRKCDFGDTVHLQMRNYLYSFEWYLGMNSWRASVNKWTSRTTYRHSLSTVPVAGYDTALADAGWHCSYCFRYLEEYAIKMQGFSHSDRLGGRKELLELDRIQDIICQGKDIFDMLPEAYSYGSMLTQMYLQAQKSAVHIPRHVVNEHERFRFLLPNGCTRELANETHKVT